MEKLNRLIQDASNQFQCHNFQTSLDLYLRCIQTCEKERLPKYILYNLKSSEAALRTILGQFDQALTVCNQVLENDKQHWLCLLRRSQIYKKQLKFKKALKDLQSMSMFAPDNMQVAALKLQIKGLMSKPGDQSSQSQDQSNDIDQQQLLKFSNLKKIDRSSVSIMIPRGRQSRVTISGDSAFVYESQDNEKRQSIFYAPKFICQRFIEIDQELEEDQTHQSDNNAPVAVIKARPSRGKSILKNRQSQLFVTDNKQVNKQGIKLIEKLQNIDGKVINSQSSLPQGDWKGQRQVQFKKSNFSQDLYKEKEEIAPKKVIKKGPRKSCLKRSSFQIDNQEVQKQGRRTSKFQVMNRNSIDGKFISSNKKRVSALKQTQKQNIGGENNDSDQDSDSGSFNIFGSKKVQITKELRQNLGFGSSDSVCEQTPANKKKERTRSILKKNSLLMPANKKVSIFCREAEQEKIKMPERKAKKSVMFRH